MGIILKTCSKCKEQKPQSEFYKSKSASDGLYPSCKECKSAVSNSWREQNAEYISDYLREWRANHPERCLEYGRKKYRKYRDKILKKQEEYRKKNRDKINARNRKRYWRNREYEIERKRKYREEHRDRRNRKSREYYRQNKAKHRQTCKRWARRNRDKIRDAERRRRARKHNAPGNFTSEEFDALCEKYGNRCLCCGTTEKITADHVIPLSCGGPHSISNIQPLCRSCNASKGTKTIDYR